MSTAPVVIERLREGEQITAEEFMRRWEADPDLKFAELLDGTVFMPSPLSLPHGEFDSLLNTWLGNYGVSTPGCRAVTNATWLMSDRDVPQPDMALRILPGQGGQSREAGVYGAGAPEFIVEVSYSSRARDIGPKLRLYERVGVREYLSVLVKKQRVIWRALVDGRFQEIGADEDGILRSRIFPGLWLNVAALWAQDGAALVATLRQGIDTPDHATFIDRLAGQG